ncbi:hypothetical protein AB4037_34435 [Labrys sp. KB_33_2]|uniref:hypothetical protein n=1 Tax=Labrys sp. KB_33_2 TaxID=3237479 RepID=UPI003F906A1F
MPKLLRYLVVYDLVEDYDLSADPQFLIELLKQSEAKPNKIGFAAYQQTKSKSPRISKKHPIEELIIESGAYDRVSLDEIVGENYLNIDSHIAYQRSRREYIVALNEAEFSIDKALDHLNLLCQRVTPRYGFVNVERPQDALYHPFGTASAAADPITAKRISDLGYSRRTTKEHRSGKLHDVYPLNVLNHAHLERLIGSFSLKEWIRAGDHGELRVVKEGVYAWLIPGDKRAGIRDVLFKAGALFASI